MKTLQSELKEKGYAKPTCDSHLIIRKQMKEKLTTKELKELMGCNRSRFARGKGGAFRQI